MSKKETTNNTAERAVVISPKSGGAAHLVSRYANGIKWTKDGIFYIA